MTILKENLQKLKNSMIKEAEEKIKINRKIYDLLSRPFEPFLKAMGEDIRLIPFIEPNCMRGYLGEWEIVNNVLYLMKIKVQYHPKDEEKMIPLKIDGVVYQATWYSGELIVPLVEPTYYHPDYQPMFKKEMIYKSKKV